ncbi:MAG TPA: tRNA (adenosine(37)-N6)-threonylcarbamoyltransferase complex dimerization subunit type 1 TsaB [Gammaproteobacteria bacterium]
MTNILAIETATEACSAALLVGEDMLHQFEHQPQQQARLILPMVDALLAEAGLALGKLDAIAFGCGPGSFTGLRVAAAVTQGIAVAGDVPVLPVSTLAAIAQGAFRRHGETRVLTAIDARMQEVYWGVYALNEAGLMALQAQEHVLPPAEVPGPSEQSGDWCGAGSGWLAYAEALRGRLEEQGCEVARIHGNAWPEARDVLTLAVPLYSAGKGIEAAQVIPTYLRDKVAKSTAERASSP